MKSDVFTIFPDHSDRAVVNILVKYCYFNYILNFCVCYHFSVGNPNTVPRKLLYFVVFIAEYNYCT